MPESTLLCHAQRKCGSQKSSLQLMNFYTSQSKLFSGIQQNNLVSFKKWGEQALKERTLKYSANHKGLV